MNGRQGFSLFGPVGLWAALLSGIVVAWSPRYWAVSVAITSISIAVVCWLVASWLIPSRNINLPHQTALVALIGAWGFLQIAFRTTLLPQLTLDSSVVWAVSAGAFVLGSQLLRNRSARKLFLELLLWSLTALAVIAMLQFYSTPVRVFGIFPAPDGVTGTFLSSNQFAALMEFAAPIALWYMLDRNPATGGLCYAMILAATITAASRAGVVLVCAELMVFLGMVLVARRREARVILSLFAGLALLVSVAATIAGTDKIRARFRDRNPYAVRRELFDSTLKLIAERPWSGSGMGTWRAVYPRTATFDMAVLANEAHNDWAQWTSDGGIPFLLLMAALVIWIAKPAVQSIWGLGVLSVMAHSCVDYPIREPALSFLWFALAGVVSQFDGRNSVLKGRIRADGRPVLVVDT
jgi:O-antigen ligase